MACGFDRTSNSPQPRCTHLSLTDCQRDLVVEAQQISRTTQQQYECRHVEVRLARVRSGAEACAEVHRLDLCCWLLSPRPGTTHCRKHPWAQSPRSWTLHQCACRRKHHRWDRSAKEQPQIQQPSWSHAGLFRLNYSGRSAWNGKQHMDSHRAADGLAHWRWNRWSSQ